ncbi:MAG: flagellar hook protein FlgE [Firmicutes bacterium]|nr:flagellar hook protein FlgE [Bacillota bacterium]
MMRSLYSAVTGLKAHQTAMDVIGNNIANVNTTGYKSSSITFQELFSQTLQGATAAQDNTGGSNAIQIGLGVSVGSTTYNMESGSIESTGNSTDVAIDGDGFFIVSDGNKNYYTRAGSFSYDEEGYLTYGNDGYYVQGWQADENGNINTNSQSLENICLDLSMDPSATTYCDLTGNISSTLGTSLDLSTSQLNIEDANGDTDTISIELTETGYNTWEYTLTADNAASVFEINGATVTGSISGTIEVNSDGEVTSFTANGEDLFTNDLTIDIGGTGTDQVTLENYSAGFDISTSTLFEDTTTGESITADYEADNTATASAVVYDSQGNSHTVSLYLEKVDDNTWEINSDEILVSGASDVSTNSGTITLVFDDDGNLVSGDEFELSFTPDGLSNTQTVSIDLSDLNQYADDTDITVDSSDGYTAGTLESVSFSSSGVLVGSYSNGYSKSIAQLAIGSFANSTGLVKVGDTLFEESVNSGDVVISTAGSNGTGSIAGSSLEASNVDLSEQFTEMIKTQRGYQANSTVITTTDEMLETLVNMKR